MLFVCSLVAALTAYGLTAVSIRVSHRRGLLDGPNARSSHSELVPSVGGLGVLGGFFFGLALVLLLPAMGLVPQVIGLREALLIVLVGGGAAATGLYDDLRGLPASVKFSFLLALSIAVLVAGIRLDSVSVPFVAPVALGVLSVPLTLLWLTGFANIYNFMDGIDGMAGGTGVAYGIFLFLFASMQGQGTVAWMALLLAASSLGFLLHNFPRARAFMGDVGSLFLGMMFAVLVLWLAQDSQRPPTLVALLLVCSVFLYDSGFTLLRRLWRRENIFQAHRTHIYQRLVQAGWSHARVSTLYWVLHAVLGGLALAYLAVSDSGRLAVLGAAGLVLLMLTLGVMRLERRGAAPRESC